MEAVLLLLVVLAAVAARLVGSPRGRRWSARRRGTGADAPPAVPPGYGSGGHTDGD